MGTAFFDGAGGVRGTGAESATMSGGKLVTDVMTVGIVGCAGDVASSGRRRIGANACSFNGGKSEAKVRDLVVALNFENIFDVLF